MPNHSAILDAQPKYPPAEGPALALPLLLLVLACTPHPPATPPAAEVTLEAPPPPAGPSPAGVHPGTIRFVDLDAGTEEDRPAAGIPEGIAWVEVAGERIPVVRIESSSRGGAREILRYGPDGALLEVLHAAPPP